MPFDTLMTAEEYAPERLDYLRYLSHHLTASQAGELMRFFTTAACRLTAEQLAVISSGCPCTDEGINFFLDPSTCSQAVADILRMADELSPEAILSELEQGARRLKRHRHRKAATYKNTPPSTIEPATDDPSGDRTTDRSGRDPRALSPTEWKTWLQENRVGRLEKVTCPGLADIEYLAVGEHPRSIIIVGLHGDENSIWSSVQKVIQDKHTELGDFILVWNAHGEAIDQRTRDYRDASGRRHDLNRQFPQRGSRRSIDTPVSEKNIEHPKGRQLYRIFQRYPALRHIFTLHVENDFCGGFYMYDVPLNQRPDHPANRAVDQLVSRLQQTYREMDIPLLNGIDDGTDPLQGSTFVEGYRRIDPRKDDHSIENFPVAMRRALRAFCFETPRCIALVDGQRQDDQIAELFNQFIIPYLQGIDQNGDDLPRG